MFVEIFLFFNLFIYFILLDFASNDINQNLHAYFTCPKKLRPKHKRLKSYITKRSLMFIDDQKENLPIFDRIKIK